METTGSTKTGKLESFLRKYQNNVYSLRRNNCGQFIKSYLSNVLHIELDKEAFSNRHLKEPTIENFVKVATKFYGIPPSTDFKKIFVGDIVLAKQGSIPSFGIYLGPYCVFLSTKGLNRRVKLNDCTHYWRVKWPQ